LTKKYQHIPPAAVLKWRAAGYTLEEIGEYYSVTKQRIHQILRAMDNNKDAAWDIETWRQRRKDRNKIGASS